MHECMYVFMYSVYKVDYREAAAPKNNLPINASSCVAATFDESSVRVAGVANTHDDTFNDGGGVFLLELAVSNLRRVHWFSSHCSRTDLSRLIKTLT